jgi:uncharacterized coiled-coil DUF342 family protein
MNPGTALALFQAAPAPLGYPTVTEILTGVAAIAATILNLRLTATTNKIKLDAKEDADELRKELGGKLENLTHSFGEKLDKMTERFVPGHLDIERRSEITNKIAELKVEVQKNRDRIHELSNKNQEMLLGPIENLHNSLREKAKKITALEERERALSDRIQALTDDIREIHERLGDIERDRERR